MILQTVAPGTAKKRNKKAAKPTEPPPASIEDQPELFNAADDGVIGAAATSNAETKQPESKQPTDKPEQTVAKADDEFWAELQLMSAMAEIERDRLAIELEIATAEEVVREHKAALKNSESELSDIRDDLKEMTDELLAVARKLVALTEGKTLPAIVGSENGEDGWRAKKAKALLSGLKGLSEKKMDTLIDVAATVGELEDLRGQASIEGVAFKNVLPKGFGEALAQGIEDRLVEYIAQFRMGQSDPDRIKMASELLDEIREMADSAGWTADDCIPGESDDEHLHAGFEAFGEGKPHTAFISEDRQKARQWMIGWVGGERVKQLAAA